jgi:lysophosphatidylcholine acyltransferase/lyso-PAF acetyltransferase
MEALHARYAPFARRDAYGPMACSIPLSEKLRLCLVWLTLLPLLKALLALGVLVSFSVVCHLAQYAPARARAAALPWLAYLHVRAALLCFGFLWISRRRIGPPPRAGLVPVALVSNHVSWADILVHMAQSFPSFVAKETIRKLPLVGVIRRGDATALCVLCLRLRVRCLCAQR